MATDSGPVTLTERTYCDAGYTKIVNRDDSLVGGKILLGTAGTKVPREVAEAVGLVATKRAKGEDKDDGDSATESKDASTTLAPPAITHIGGGVYELLSGKRVKGRAEALQAAATEAAEGDAKSDGD